MEHNYEIFPTMAKTKDRSFSGFQIGYWVDEVAADDRQGVKSVREDLLAVD
jgi:hypothetical protein